MAQPNISGYTIIDLLGSGGFASVYLAIDDTSGRKMAIKVLHDHASKPDDLRRFDRERMSLRALSGHPNIVRVYDSGETEEGQHYTVLEYIDGGSVRDKIDEGGALQWSTAVEIGVQICAALDVAHRSGVLHRDVKPANILLDGDLAKLSDFGIARLVGQSQVTAAQSIIGTLAYTPPEVFHNKPFDGRGDIYQLGITLYEMLLGRAPFTSAAADNKATVIRRILDNPAPPLAQFDIPAPLSDLLDEVLAKDPADRPQSADSFGRRLNDVELQMGRTPTAVQLDTEPVLAESVWPAAATTAATVVPPAPPEVEPPPAADITIAEPLPAGTASFRAAPEPPAQVNPKRRPRWPWLVGLLVIIGAAGGGVLAWQYANPAEDSDPTTDPTDEGGVDGVAPRTPEFVALDDPAFAEPGGTDGVIFASVANSFGLTMVGGAGNGEAVNQQRSIVWTLGPVEGERTIQMRSDFAQDEGLSASNQRLWDIAVIDGKQLLAVGENQGGGGTNGIAWIGDQARFLRPANDASFQTAARESLRGASGDPLRNEFIIVGSRSAGNNLVMGLWTLAEGDGWATPTWSATDVGTAEDGVLNDVVVKDELAVAVGSEMTDGVDAAVILIRREDSWSNLISPIPNSVFHGVAIAGERIIAVGEKAGPTGPTPFAVVTDENGAGFIHNLPMRGTTGIARSIAVIDAGRVVVVGDTLGETDRDGALWELLPAQDLGDDVWTTRATPDLQVDGFTELWAIDEFDGIVYVFGRTEQDGTRPAGAWTLDLAS